MTYGIRLGLGHFDNLFATKPAAAAQGGFLHFLLPSSFVTSPPLNAFLMGPSCINMSDWKKYAGGCDLPSRNAEEQTIIAKNQNTSY